MINKQNSLLYSIPSISSIFHHQISYWTLPKRITNKPLFSPKSISLNPILIKKDKGFQTNYRMVFQKTLPQQLATWILSVFPPFYSFSSSALSITRFLNRTEENCVGFCRSGIAELGRATGCFSFWIFFLEHTPTEAIELDCFSSSLRPSPARRLGCP